MKITAIHFRKLSAVTEMKMRTLMSKNFIILYCSRSCGRKRKKYASDTDDFFSKRT